MKRLDAWIAACTLALLQPAVAGVVCYDGFGNGPRADLHGSNGGGGWTGPWQDISSSLLTGVGGAGLTYPGLRTVPGAAMTPAGGSFDAANYYRGYGAVPAPADHLFISFLLNPGSGFGTFGGISFGGYSMIGVPLTYSSYGMRLGRYLFVDTGISVVQGQTTLLVLELLIANGRTTYRMFVNPNLNQGQPAAASAEYTVAGTALPQGLYLMNDGGFVTDEIRVATTWAEALPPPSAHCFTITGPVATTTCPGGSASFVAEPQGTTGTTSYRWYRGPVELWDGPTGFGSVVSGAHTGTLTLTGVSDGDASFYYCQITDSCGAVTSGAATLSVVPGGCGPGCDPDVNCDGVPDQGDVACMILAVAGDTACFCQADADFNHDGVPDQGDVSDVILTVAGAPCP